MDAGTTDVVVALIGAIAAIVVAVVGVQLKVHHDNRKDHGETAAKVDQLLDRQQTIQRDVTLIRSDVTEIHGAIRELRATDAEVNRRVTKIERIHQEDIAS